LMERLAAIPGPAALAARFCILTATRPGETFNAKWSEITGDMWTIPAGRYKTGKQHTVPLSSAALAILDQAPRFEGNSFIFVSPMKHGASISAMSVIQMFKRHGIKTTLHGTARSTFSDWAHNETRFPHEVIEQTLGHTLGGVVRAYWRRQPIDKIHQLLEMWGEQATTEDAALAMVAE
jgi:integrase